MKAIRIVKASSVVALILIFVTSIYAKKNKASDYFTLCRRNDPDLSGCVKRSIEKSKPLIIKGIPELKMPSVDPLHIPALELQEGQGGFKFSLKMKNLTITGLKDFTVKSVKVDLQKGTWDLALETPHTHFEADYEMGGQILSLPIQGNGQCTFDFYEVSTVATVQNKNITRGGKVYSQIENLKWTIDVKGAKSYFTNLFNGDKTLGETTNKFFNDNWKDAFETYKHLPEEAFGQFFKELDNRFYDQFPIDELYPE